MIAWKTAHVKMVTDLVIPLHARDCALQIWYLSAKEDIRLRRTWIHWMEQTALVTKANVWNVSNTAKFIAFVQKMLNQKRKFLSCMHCWRRSSRAEAFLVKVVLQLYWKRGSDTAVFPVDFAEFSRTHFS